MSVGIHMLRCLSLCLSVCQFSLCSLHMFMKVSRGKRNARNGGNGKKHKSGAEIDGGKTMTQRADVTTVGKEGKRESDQGERIQKE